MQASTDHGDWVYSGTVYRYFFYKCGVLNARLTTCKCEITHQEGKWPDWHNNYSDLAGLTDLFTSLSTQKALRVYPQNIESTLLYCPAIRFEHIYDTGLVWPPATQAISSIG